MTRRLPPLEDLPPMEPPVRVVGDVHLTEEEPQVAKRFSAYVDQAADEGGTLVLLGDIFDWWVGRVQARRQPFSGDIIKHLAAASARGLRLAFLTGNRDYTFDGMEGLDIELWPDVVRTRWGDRTVVLSHGDLLCSGDGSYHSMRAFLRSMPGRALLGAIPFAGRAYLASGLRDLSDRAIRRKSAKQLNIDYGLARRWLDRYGADALVVGHVHTGVHHELPGDRRRDVYVLKDWSHAPNEVVYDGTSIRLRRL